MSSHTVNKKLVLFCDFDGTITEQDNIIAIMRRFAPPGWEELTQQILGQTISIREGVGKLFAMLQSSLKEEITQYIVGNASIRLGFAEFVRYCKEQEIELLITSGGIDFFVHPILSTFELPSEAIYCNGSDFRSERIAITWPNSCDHHCNNDCGMCKTTIIRRYDPMHHIRIVIGDSITDLAGARIADFVIARSLLQQKCEELQLPHAPFGTFFDVISILEKQLYQQEVKPR